MSFSPIDSAVRSIAVRGLGCALLLCSAAASAQQLPEGWAGTLKGGYIRTSGNANTSAANVKGELDYTFNPWQNVFTFAAGNGRQRGVTAEERYSLGDKLKFAFNEVDYAFGQGTYDNDRFAGIQQRYSETLGYGRRLLMTERQTLDAEVGIGANQQLPADEDRFETQLIGTFGGKYTYTISDSAQFLQTLRTEVGTSNTFINPVSSLKLTIVNRVYAMLDYEVRYNTTVPDATKHTDIITSVNLGYAFGRKL